jgi:transposase
VDRVIVVSPDDTGIASARAKTDKLDARALAVLCWKGEIDAVWMPDERCRILRRRLARREQLVHGRELELTAGAKPRTKAAAGIWSTNRTIRDAERALTLQAEISYKRMVTDQQAGRPAKKVGASATPERA